jgi:hypothetical protein
MELNMSTAEVAKCPFCGHTNLGMVKKRNKFGEEQVTTTHVCLLCDGRWIPPEPWKLAAILQPAVEPPETDPSSDP